MLAYHSALDVSTCLIMSFDPYIGKCGVHFCLSMIHSQVQISCTCIYTLFGLFPSGVEYPGRKMTNFFVFFVGILISDRGFHSYNEKLLVMLLWFYYARKLFPCFYFPFWFLFIFIFILSFSLSFFSLRLHFHSLYLMILHGK